MSVEGVVSVHGIIPVYKPKGCTSFDVVAIMRRLLNTKKIGHSGTLDPIAEGVLPIFVGAATKAIDFCPVHDKEYRGAFRLGLTSDTQDISGAVLTESSCAVTESRLRRIAGCFVGEISQIPPMYSAVKIGGRKLCDLARRGVEVERKSRVITIRELEIESYDEGLQSGVIRVVCTKGTYVRTLIHDIGAQLGCGAVMSGLERTRSNGFGVEDCYRLDELRTLTGAEIQSLLLPIEHLFSYPQIVLDEEQTRLFRNGAILDAARVRYERDCGVNFTLFDCCGQIIALVRIEQDSLLVIQRFSYG